jgi:hypothetical protein
MVFRGGIGLGGIVGTGDGGAGVGTGDGVNVGVDEVVGLGVSVGAVVGAVLQPASTVNKTRERIKSVFLVLIFLRKPEIKCLVVST